MLFKSPKSSSRTFIKTAAKYILVVEAISFAAAYGCYFRMNRNRDYRKYLSEHYPFVLESYYKVGEYFEAGIKIRELDLAAWSAEE